MINVYNAKNYTKLLETVIQECLSNHQIPHQDVEVELDFLDKIEMTELNNAERGINEVTDVLSFPNLEVAFPFSKKDYANDINPETGAVMLGEIYICKERAAEQAIEYGHSFAREVAFLALHGMLHLIGYDHITEDDRLEMEAESNEILDKLVINRELLDEEVLLKFGKAELDDVTADDFSINTDTENTIEENKVVVKCNTDSPTFKSGYVAILGRPNAGKSTLINALVGEKVSIVSWKPQTTRDKILGIISQPDYQIVFIDTPGLHAPRNTLGDYMMKNVTRGLEGADAILYMVDGEKGLLEQDRIHLEKYLKNQYKVIILLNKIDHITTERVGEILTQLSVFTEAKAIIPISSLRNKNIKVIIPELLKLLNGKEKYFDEDMYTDKSMRFITAEVIREKALRLLDKEIPYGIGVAINKYEFREDGLLMIDADIICEKRAHKPIILGKDGQTIKKIATYARQDLESITGNKIFLTVWLRIKEDWRENTNILSELGYSKEKE